MTVTTEGTAVGHEDLMSDLLQDPEFREDWEASTFARVVANQVIRYRVDHDLSQRKLAIQLGIHASQVARLELGEHEPRVSTLQLLTRRLGLRFHIDIHPAGHAPMTHIAAGNDRVERAISDGVETIVYAAF